MSFPVSPPRVSNPFIAAAQRAGSAALSAATPLIDDYAPRLKRVFEDRLRRSVGTEESRRREGLSFATHPSPIGRFLPTLFGSQSAVFNHLGLKDVVLVNGSTLAHYGLQVGVEKFCEDYQGVATDPDSRIPIDPQFLPEAQLHRVNWIRKYAQTHNIDVRFEGTHLIPPPGELVVYVVVAHSSIWPDMFLTYVDQSATYVTDEYNFRTNKFAIKSGFGLLTDIAGWPLVARPSKETGDADADRASQKLVDQRNETLFSHLIDASIKHGIRPAWFVHGGRVETAYDDDGALARAGYYSRVVNPKAPRQYLQMGGAVGNAVQLARKAGKPVKVLIVRVEGAEKVMPKWSANAPFLQDNIAGGRVTYRFVEGMEVPVPADDRVSRRLMVELNRKLPDLFRQIPWIGRTGETIDQYLARVVDQWGKKDGRSHIKDTKEKFLARAVKDEAYFIIADRIRSLDPKNRATRARREFAIECLLDLVHAAGEPSRKQVDALLVEVSAK